MMNEEISPDLSPGAISTIDDILKWLSRSETECWQKVEDTKGPYRKGYFTGRAHAFWLARVVLSDAWFDALGSDCQDPEEGAD